MNSASSKKIILGLAILMVAIVLASLILRSHYPDLWHRILEDAYSFLFSGN